jgi:hypothetical protein
VPLPGRPVAGRAGRESRLDGSLVQAVRQGANAQPAVGANGQLYVLAGNTLMALMSATMTILVTVRHLISSRVTSTPTGILWVVPISVRNAVPL